MDGKAAGRPESKAGTHIGRLRGSEAGSGNFQVRYEGGCILRKQKGQSGRQKESHGTAPESTSIASSDS
eukprot:12823365-Prorocentrum_lima.AAC.1